MVEIEDEDFLSQVAALEAEALFSSATKRRRTSDSTTTGTTTAVEGAYIAALKGSKSNLFQQQIAKNNTHNHRNNSSNFNNLYYSSSDNKNNNSNQNLGFSDGGTCFNCGKVGHWARDCDQKSYAVEKGDVAEKNCPCGFGTCIVLTANTEKNRGRKFYKCPLRQENGGCGFFEWCDNATGTDNITFRSQTKASSTSVSELSCPCGAGSCLILTAKTGKNIGQQFYKCPAGQGSCGFFKWCHDDAVAASISSSVNTPSYQNIRGMSNNIHNATNFSCFSCGKEGHWAKDCKQSSSISPAERVGKSASSNTCFKCGRAGHWAKDCLSTSETKVKFGQ